MKVKVAVVVMEMNSFDGPRHVGPKLGKMLGKMLIIDLLISKKTAPVGTMMRPGRRLMVEEQQTDRTHPLIEMRGNL